QLVTYDAPHQVLARDLAALEIERIAIAVVARLAKDAHVTVIFEPAQLAIVGDVAPEQVATLATPRGSLRPQDWFAVDITVPEALDGGVALDQIAKCGVDSQDVWVVEVRARRAIR